MLEWNATPRFRRPEYTGENRCLPCTGLNLLIVICASGLLQYWGEPVVGLFVGGLGLFLIYARGYVVPGTPTLTRRFLPASLLAWFEHDEMPAGAEQPVERDQSTDSGDQFDPEGSLRDAGALRTCPNRDDLCLDEVFRRKWNAAMNDAVGDVQSGVENLIPEPVNAPITVEFRGETVVARVSETTVAQWPSRAAVVADIAGGAVLAETDADWDDRDFADRTRLLGGLRLWLDRCSVCDGRLELGEEVVESCCRSVPVFAMTCTDCGARILEAPLPEEA
jgi:hypothetical protein